MLKKRKLTTATVKVNSATSTKLDNFNHYFVNNYIKGQFPMIFCNHFSIFGPRTNNNVEDYNNKFKCFVGDESPNIFKYLKMKRHLLTKHSEKQFHKILQLNLLL